jgi:hypothetical protein
VDHYDDVRGLVTEDASALFRQPAEIIQLVQIAGDAEPLLRHLRTRGGVSILNLPEDDPAAAAFHSLGGTVPVRQHEMLLELRH